MLTASPPQGDELMPGRLLNGRYRLLAVIGQGGMAMVFHAHDLCLNRDVAVKVLHARFAAEKRFVDRFDREARLGAELTPHPHIMSVFDAGEDRGLPYIVMELVAGRNLKEFIASDAPLTIERAFAIGQALASSLAVLHGHGLVHRDMKPQNVLLGKNGTIKLGDFGIMHNPSSPGMTTEGVVLGTAQYLSPEQAQGKPAEITSDVYSLGVILFEMLTGRVPFDGDSPLSIAMQHAHAEPPTPRALNPSITPAAAKVVLRALRKDPRERYQSAEEFARAMRGARVAEDAQVTMHSPLKERYGDLRSGLRGLKALLLLSMVQRRVTGMDRQLLKIDEDYFCRETGMSGLPNAEREQAFQSALRVVNARVMKRVQHQLGWLDRGALERLEAKPDNDLELAAFLSAKVPDLNALVREEFEAYTAELKEETAVIMKGTEQDPMGMRPPRQSVPSFNPESREASQQVLSSNSAKLVAAPQPVSVPIPQGRSSAGYSCVDRLFADVVNRGNMALIDELFQDNVTCSYGTLSGESFSRRGRDVASSIVSLLRKESAGGTFRFEVLGEINSNGLTSIWACAGRVGHEQEIAWHMRFGLTSYIIWSWACYECPSLVVAREKAAIQVEMSREPRRMTGPQPVSVPIPQGRSSAGYDCVDRLFVDVVNRGDMALVDELFEDNVTCAYNTLSAEDFTRKGRDVARSIVSLLRTEAAGGTFRLEVLDIAMYGLSKIPSIEACVVCVGHEQEMGRRMHFTLSGIDHRISSWTTNEYRSLVVARENSAIQIELGRARYSRA
jgi:serine/threonine protein kinase